ncbi:MAG TPA: hypothetical protein VJW96_08810 [Terriglobales bacterium]|nr:hypothetical protein [Terriglobales bacterium]
MVPVRSLITTGAPVYGHGKVLDASQHRRQVRQAGCRRIDFNASPVAGARDRVSEFAVDGIGDFARRREIRLAQKQRNRSQAVEIKGQTAFHPAPRRNSSRRGVVHLLARTRASSRKTAHRDRTLRGGIDLPVCAVQRRHQEHPTLQTLGVADRGNGHVHLGAGPRERRQTGGHKHRRHILDDRRHRRNLRAQALQDVG